MDDRSYCIEHVGCDESHHFYYSYLFSYRMRNNLKIRRFAIGPGIGTANHACKLPL